MIDYTILKNKGTTDERMREIFTRKRPEDFDSLPEDQKARIEADLKTRKYWEDRIGNHQWEQISYNLQHSHVFAAVDLAFDCKPIAKEWVPLMLFAQDKLDTRKCVTSLKTLEGWQSYVAKNKDTGQEEINVPKFIEVSINLVHSLVTRRLSAQSTKYNSFTPYFKYDPRLTSQVGKLRADALSQRVDAIVDQFDIRGHNEQVERDALLYTQTVDFPTEPWIRLKQMRQNNGGALPTSDPEHPITEDYIVKEGLDWTNPHPSHLIWDRSKPLSAIRKDIDLNYIGYWDVQTYGTVADNPDFYNRDEITYGDNFLSLFTQYPTYWSQYYCTINTGSLVDRLTSTISDNARTYKAGRYAQDVKDQAMLLTVYFAKIVPSDWGIGTYAFPVWVRFITAGNGTIVSAKIFPSSPAAYCGINQRDSRMWSSSFAMQVMPFQDQLSNLTTQLMAELKARRIKFFGMDTDGMKPEEVKAVTEKLRGQNYYEDPIVIEYSGSKAQETGMTHSHTNPVSVCQPANNPQDITSIIQAMIQTIAMAERINVMSSNEVGQPIVRGNGGVTATEAGNIENTTNVTSSFVADAFDSYHADMKRIIYESLIASGSDVIKVPVVNRYPPSVVKQAGFEIYDEDGDGQAELAVPIRRTVIGTKENLVYEYVFSTRDGAKRAVNTQTATTLIQLLPVLQNEVFMAAVGKAKLFEIINEIFRLSGAGIDLNLEVAPGEENMMLPSQEEQTKQLADMVGQVVEAVKKNQADIQGIQQFLQQLTQGMQQAPAQPMMAPPQR